MPAVEPTDQQLSFRVWCHLRSLCKHWEDRTGIHLQRGK